jgi:hypothetical protein
VQPPAVPCEDTAYLCLRPRHIRDRTLFPETVEKITQNTVWRAPERSIINDCDSGAKGQLKKMSPADEPKGWRILQAMAQSENDPERLACIIDRMNRLLDAHERCSGNTNSWTVDPDLN